MVPLSSCSIIPSSSISQDVIFMPSISIFPYTIIPFSPASFRYCTPPSPAEATVKVTPSATCKVAFRMYWPAATPSSCSSLPGYSLYRVILRLQQQDKDDTYAAVHMMQFLLTRKEE